MSKTMKIPDGWEQKKFGNIFDFKNGVNAEKSSYGQGIKFINVMDVFQGNSITSENVKGQITLCDKKVQDNLVVRGDVLFNRTSEVLNEIGLTSVYLDDEPVVFGGFVIKGHELKDVLDNSFKKYCFSSSLVRKEIIRRGQGAIRTNIGQKDLEKVKLLVPPLEEQKAIAGVLSVWDEGIEKITKLIALKEKKFKWLLKTLISDQCSMNNENPSWKKVKLGEVCEIRTGKLDANKMIDKGQYRFYTCAKNYYRIDSFAFDTEALIISGNGANVGYIHYYKGKFNAYQRTYVLDQFMSYIDIRYVQLLLDSSLAKRIHQEKSEGNTPYIRMSALSLMNISFPPIEEQKQIASTLNTAQKEIDLLKKIADKYKEQKKGLMQKLLTGEWRVGA